MKGKSNWQLYEQVLYDDKTQVASHGSPKLNKIGNIRPPEVDRVLACTIVTYEGALEFKREMELCPTRRRSSSTL